MGNLLRRLKAAWANGRQQAPALKALARLVVLVWCWPKFLTFVFQIGRDGLFSLAGLKAMVCLAVLIWHSWELACHLKTDLRDEADGITHNRIAAWPIALAMALTMTGILFWAIFLTAS